MAGVNEVVRIYTQSVGAGNKLFVEDRFVGRECLWLPDLDFFLVGGSRDNERVRELDDVILELLYVEVLACIEDPLVFFFAEVFFGFCFDRFLGLSFLVFFGHVL